MSVVSESLPSAASAVARPVDRSFSLRLMATTFLGAFLLFQVQPLIGKAVLPWFGGAPAVWTTALLFFQLMLVAGYALAFLSTRFLSPTLRSYLYLALAATALLLLPIGADESWKPNADDEPVGRMLALLLVCVGGPYLVLASTAPTTQEWFSRSGSRSSPYRLYALSNAGSLLGLLTYPFLVERYFDSTAQAYLWSGGFLLFALSAASCAWSVRHRDEPAVARERPTHDDSPVSFGNLATWIGLAAAGTILLMSATHHLCQDIASVPFLWVAPLAVYLLTFIICFDHARWYCRTWYSVAAAILIPLACLQGVTIRSLETSRVWAAPYLLPLRDISFGTQAAIVLGMLFAVCMLCHGELAARKPSPDRLTLYFLAIAVGGALGGLFTAVVAPVIFDRNWEWMLATFAALGFALAGIGGALRRAGHLQSRINKVGLGTAAIGCAALLLWLHSLLFNADEVVSARNFYGVVSVDVGTARETGEPTYVSMRSGTTFHGLQLIGDELRFQPTAYYGTESGVGRTLLAARRSDRPLRVACIGLGVGTLAAYGRPGDRYDFFEINPVVIRFADEYFSFLRDSEAGCRVVQGDARLSLERALGAGDEADYDVIVLDAFSGDSIPTHLLTAEAFDVYLRHLKPDGVIAAHMSNRYLDLIPVIVGAAQHRQLAALTGVNRPNDVYYVKSSRWALLTRNPNSPEWRELQAAGFTDITHSKRALLWTDAYGNLFEILK